MNNRRNRNFRLETDAAVAKITVRTLGPAHDRFRTVTGVPTMMTRILTIAATCLAFSGTTQAGFNLTGNPANDSVGGGLSYWLDAGNSLTTGHYIRGAGGFDFHMYRAQFQAGDVTSVAGGVSGLAAATGWSPSDEIRAMGGVINAVTANLTDDVRIVSKFSNAGTAGFTADSGTPASPAGNGKGSFSGGDGGPGSVLIGTDEKADFVVAANANQLVKAAYNYYRGSSAAPGTNGLTLSDDDARIIFTLDSGGLLKSWEVLLNLTKLSADLLLKTGVNNSTVPSWDGSWDQALQSGTSTTQFTDAVNKHNPAPPTLIALAGGAAFFGLARLRRRLRA